MNNNEMIEKIKKAAKADERKRNDIRYKYAMAFLVKKGFLKTNTDFTRYYRAKVTAKDLIWAGKNVEPRILEVLPAAALRLPKAIKVYGLSPDEKNLQRAMQDLKKKKNTGHNFLNMPFEKIKTWMNLKLNDGRTKLQSEKKIMTTFRLKPKTLKNIEQLRIKNGFKTHTELIEQVINNLADSDDVI